jgi:pimeloyl-ACP methyl ester carboxylesterase
MDVTLDVGGLSLEGTVEVPSDPAGVVVFAHGSGSSRHSPRNVQVASALQRHGLATVLFDLLTRDEEDVDRRTRRLRFDIPLLSGRLVGAVDWLDTQPRLRTVPAGLFGASTGAAAALRAAAARPQRVAAVVSRGGRPDLAADALRVVQAPTLLIVGERDRDVLALNREAAAEMRVPYEIAVVPAAGHLFEEPGALQEVARLAGDWFRRHLQPRPAAGDGG